MTKLLRSPEFTLAASAAILAGVTALAYDWLGFLGIALVGLFLVFMAVQSEIQKDGMRRPFVAEKLSQTARMAQDAEREDMARFWWRAKIVGTILAAVGLTGFVWFQLPS
jgi:hypothetical protein